MGMLFDGQWDKTISIKTAENGCFIRPLSSFRHRVTADGSSNFKAQANRYHLYVSYACPWAHRTLIMRAIKGLENVISVSIVEPLLLENGWKFSKKNSSTSDEINHANFLYEIYVKADPNYTGKVTVPVLWDKQQHTIVNNESAEIMRMLNCEFNQFATVDVNYYPANLKSEIDAVNELVYQKINNGVYKCGFASTQTAYDEALVELFTALDQIENLLDKQRYLVGQQITEADWRLFVTLIRFDIVYVGHFKCNLKRIDDYPNLSEYLRELYQFPGIKSTINFTHIKQHYYGSHLHLNPNSIIPGGPILDFERPHHRA